jgi:pyridoxamine 5'-phosphate oxidase
MIEFKKINKAKPYILLNKLYQEACNNHDPLIDVIAISSFNKNEEEVHTRFVNLKYIINEEWIFFSNYESNKAHQFNDNNNIAATIYWKSIDVQIRIQAKIFKSAKAISDNHFKSRSNAKNALAISSSQSRPIGSYDDVVKNYKNILNNEKSLIRPDYWGGFSFFPYSFEFWTGHSSRVNKREVYKYEGKSWKESVLQP